MKAVLLVFCLAFAAASGQSLQKILNIAVQELIEYYREDYVLRNYYLEFVDYDKENDSYTLRMVVGRTDCKVAETNPDNYDACRFIQPFRKCTVNLVPGGPRGYQLKLVTCSLQEKNPKTS